jgi:hypothetical protein
MQRCDVFRVCRPFLAIVLFLVALGNSNMYGNPGNNIANPPVRGQSTMSR